ncbi:MAG: histidinol-phosphatase HisJ family protein [Thermoanaerobacteraceae bacterium]|nr:histidinol-phosphatase HisJ family protein [Thermoanaerobacteraceae bacterium]
MIDYHIHTQFSKDSKLTMEDVCKQAIEMGLQEICFTDHWDLNPSGEYFDFDLNYQSYTMEYIRCSEMYGDKIKIKKGLEIGLQSHLLDKIDKLLKDKNFDFILGSIHYVNKVDLFKEDFYKNREKSEAFNEYLQEVYTCITEFDNFDCLGHLDVIRRYCIYNDKSLLYDDYMEILDKILIMLVNKNKGLEANISAERYGLGNILPSEEIFKRYGDLEGKIVTLGSDSHLNEHFKIERKKYINILKECGFTHVASFENRNLCLIPIDELE